MEKIIFHNKYRSVRQYGEIIFFQRRGIDSIAFILFDKNKDKPYGLIRERKPVLDYRYQTEECLKNNDFVFSTEHGVFLQTAFGGSSQQPRSKGRGLYLDSISMFLVQGFDV